MGRTHVENAEILSIFLGGPMDPIHPVWALAAVHPWWGCMSFGSAIARSGKDNAHHVKADYIAKFMFSAIL